MLLVFIGFLLAHAHININEFDLLPNFLGFFLVFLGLRQLEHQANSFGKGKPWALGLAIFHLITLFPISLPVPAYGIIELLSLSASAYLIYLICIGVRELEQSRGQDLGSQKMLTIWKLYTVCVLAAALLTYVPLGFAMLIGIVLAVVSLVCIILLLVRLYRVYKALE